MALGVHNTPAVDRPVPRRRAGGWLGQTFGPAAGEPVVRGARVAWLALASTMNPCRARFGRRAALSPASPYHRRHA